LADLLPRGAFGFSTGFVGRGFGLAIERDIFLAAVAAEPLGIGFGLLIGMLLTLLS
jgi:hypothetical protein